MHSRSVLSTGKSARRRIAFAAPEENRVYVYEQKALDEKTFASRNLSPPFVCASVYCEPIRLSETTIHLIARWPYLTKVRAAIELPRQYRAGRWQGSRPMQHE